MLFFIRVFLLAVLMAGGRDEAIREWWNWSWEDPLVDPYKWLRPDLEPPVPCLQCKPHPTPGGSGILADPARIDEGC